MIIGALCAALSCFLIVKSWALMGDAISHAVLPGVALAYLLGIPLLIGAFLSGLFCAVSIGYIKKNCRVREDAVMGILFSGMFAVGLMMVVSIESDVHLLHILFGNVLGITWNHVLSTALLTACIGAMLYIKKSDLILYCFDTAQAKMVGISETHMVLLLQCLLAITIVAALYTAGIILVIAFLITPGATAYLISPQFNRMLKTAISIAVITCFCGTLLSYHWDIATAPLIVLLQSACFLSIFLWRSVPLAPKKHTISAQ